MFYETHVTVEEAPSLKLSLAFKHICELQGWKCNLIELSRGSFPLQLMLAAKKEVENDEAAIAWGGELADFCSKDGWNVVRIKVESPLVAVTPHAYFEAHYKFHITNADTKARFIEFATKEGFLRSHNLFRRSLHYLSLRNYGTSAETANLQFDKGWYLIKGADLGFESAHYERVLIDTNPKIDEGWTA